MTGEIIMITKTFEITATKNVMEKFERFLAFMHFNGGHSAVFGMAFDGDGWDRLQVKPSEDLEKYRKDVSKIGGCGPEFEVAHEDCYWATSGDYKKNRYKVKNGKIQRFLNTSTQPNTFSTARKRTHLNTRLEVSAPDKRSISCPPRITDH